VSDSILPAARPCGTCPYRRDVPSGIWDESEYVKLPRYDLDTWEQIEAGAHRGFFYCHQQDGRLCAGWVGCHDMATNAAMRIGVSSGWISPENYEEVCDYETPVPLFDSGQEAHDHGMAEYHEPSPAARKRVAKLIQKIGDNT